MEIRIVHIDDDEITRDMLTLAIKREGWLLFSYPYARVKLVPLEQIRPDLIILDFALHDGGEGWEFLQFLKMDDATAKIPIMVITTPFRLSADIKAYLLTRYIKILHKPFDRDMFVPLISKTLTEASQRSLIFSGDPTLPILLVDDDEDFRDTIANVLRLEGYRVVTAYNGQVALDTISRADYSLILLDIDTPIMNGYQFLSAYDRQLRPHTPVIIASGETDIQSHVLPSFVVDVLSKPYLIKKLLNLVEKYAQPV